ncbi:hypothetical protein [Gracilimonas sp.]|uniref:hypothetical protein n=1 Tax=Gracilimonas sp. TaxID=1974203 RepID=UPI0028710925|nr:hypothetical protein [Gracilimonas sp.]
MKKTIWFIALISIFPCLCNDAKAQGNLPKLENILFDNTFFYATVDGESKVVKIDSLGSIVAEFEAQGRGPGEFSSSFISITLSDDILYVLDKRGYKIVEINKDDFSFKTETVLEGNPMNLFGYNNKLLGLRIKPKTISPDGEKSLFDVYYTGEDVFGKENDERGLFFQIEEEIRLNPFYDKKIAKRANQASVIYYPNKNNFYVFYRDSLYSIEIPGIETKSLGKKIENEMPNEIVDNVLKYKFTPAYKLVQSIVKGNQPNTFLIQIKSYKKGSALLEYNYEHQEFEQIGNFSLGEVIGVNKGSIFYYSNNEILKAPINSIGKCSDYSLDVYLSSIEDICESCESGMMDFYEQAKQKLIPVNIYVKEDSWFFKADEGDYKEVSDFLIDHKMWGRIQIIDDCDNCFDSQVHLRLKKSRKVQQSISLPSDTQNVEAFNFCN